MGDWKIVASAGTVVASSVPDAPNVLDTGPNPTTVTVVYGMIGNASAYGFSWSISLPTTNPNYAHDKKIHVVRVRGSHLDELKTEYAPWASSPLTGDSGAEPRWFQDDASHTDSVEFLCENDEGSITASPVTKSVTIAAAAVSACPAVDASTLLFSNPEYHARFQDLATALHTVINTHVSMANGQYPQTATLWINKQDGNGPLWQGWWKITGAAQLIQIGLPNSNTDVYPPGGASDGSWLMIAAAGAIPAEAGVPSSALTSAAFTVPTIPAPGPHDATGAWIDQIDYGNNGETNTWGWKNLFTTLPYNDPNFFFGRWTVQNGSLSGSVFTPGTPANFAQHDGAEVTFSDDDNGGNGSTVLRMPGTNIVTVTNPLMWTLPAYRLSDGSLNPNSCFCFRNYVGSRRNTDGSGGTITQQQDWSSGVGVSTPGTASQLYVVLDLTKAQIHGRQIVGDSIPASAIASVDASAIQGSIYASSIASVNASAITGTVNASSIGSVNASTINGTINASNIGSVNASTINGTIFASSIGSVNASVINGTFYASSIGSVNAAVIAGTLYASSIGSVNAAAITGMLYASSIGSVNASTINGTLYASSIGSVNASVVNGTFYASSIGSVNAATIAGVLYASSIGSVSATTITGVLYASSIASVNASTISGTLVASSIGSVNASVINGSLYASSIASVAATTINGLIVTSQIANGIIDSIAKFAAGISVVQRVAALPSTAGLPDGALALLTVPTPARLYQIVTGAWTLVTASSSIVGQLQATDIANIQASQINGLILAAQISQINASQINGSIYASSIATVNASTINGSIYASSIASVNAAAIAVVNATAISGSLYASSIATVNATALKGSIYASSIASLSASVIAGFIYASSISSVNATALTGSIYASSIASVSATTLTGTVYASSIASVTASSISVVAGAAGTINVGAGGLSFQGTGGITFNDGSGHSGSIVWQTLTAGYGVGVNTNFSVNGSMFSSGNYWCGTQVSANTLAIYNSSVGTLNVVDNNFIFVGRGVSCPDYGIACAGVNPKVSGVQKYGATYELQYKDWSGANQTAHISGGIVTTS